MEKEEKFVNDSNFVFNSVKESEVLEKGYNTLYSPSDKLCEKCEKKKVSFILFDDTVRSLCSDCLIKEKG